MERKLERAVKTTCRAAFVGLFLFEAVNYAQLLHLTPDFTWVGLLITSATVALVLEACAGWLARRGARLHWSAWPLTLAIVSFDAFGDMLHFYGRWSWYDQIGHALGGFLGVLVIFTVVQAIETTDRWRHPSWVNGVLALGSTMTFGAMYEIEEYTEDVFNATNRLGDGRDTANDLLMNLIGGMLALAAFYAVRRWKKIRVRGRS